VIRDARSGTRRLFAAAQAAGLTGTGVAVVAGAAATWVAGFLFAGRVLYLLAYGAGVAVALAWVAGHAGRHPPVVRDPLPARVTEGDRVTVAVRVAGRLGTGTLLVERLPEPLGGDRPLVPGADGVCSYELVAGRRGEWQLGPTVAVRADAAGLTERARPVAPVVELLVHPGIEALGDRPLARLLEDPPLRPPRPRPWPSGLEFAGAQPYTPGDDLRRVLWRAYARTGELLVRESERGITDRAVLVVATDRSQHSPGDPSASFEAAVRAAASLGVAHLTEGFEVTLLAGPHTVGPLRGAASRVVLLDALARLRTDRAPLAATLERLLGATPPDTHLVVITPSLCDEDLARLDMLVAGGRSALVVGLAFSDDHIDGLARAPSAGCRLVDVHPDERLASAFARHRLGASA
jgi:uncharacterized protein (DUF58 family)